VATTAQAVRDAGLPVAYSDPEDHMLDYRGNTQG